MQSSKDLGPLEMVGGEMVDGKQSKSGSPEEPQEPKYKRKQ